MEMPKKEIEIDWNGKKEKVVIRRLSFGETGEVSDIVAPMTAVGGQQTVTLNQHKIRMESMLRCIVSAPFTVDKKTIYGLPNDVGEKIYQEIDQFNSLTPAKKEN